MYRTFIYNECKKIYFTNTVEPQGYQLLRPEPYTPIPQTYRPVQYVPKNQYRPNSIRPPYSFGAPQKNPVPTYAQQQGNNAIYTGQGQPSGFFPFVPTNSFQLGAGFPLNGALINTIPVLVNQTANDAVPNTAPTAAPAAAAALQVRRLILIAPDINSLFRSSTGNGRSVHNRVAAQL